MCVSRHRELEAIEGERLAMAKEEERMAALEAVKQAELRKRNLLHKLEIQTQVWLGGGMEGEAGGRGAI